MSLPVSAWLRAAGVFAGVCLLTPDAHADPVADATDQGRAEPEAEQASTRPSLDVQVLGGISLSIPFIDWGRAAASGARDGDLRFDVLRFGVRASYGDFTLDTEYRLYPQYHFLRRAIIGYERPHVTFDIGVSRAPFGLLPFASNSWFFGLPYYVGLEDDADFGLRARIHAGGFEAWVAFYKNGEGSFSGRSQDSARFSYDVVRAPAAELALSGITADRNDRETNELVLRVAYDLHAGPLRLELGASGRVGSLHDVQTDARSPHLAGALHVRATLAGVRLDLEAAAYTFSPHVAATDDARLVAMGAFDAPYAVARRGSVIVANLSYGADVAWGPVELLRVYFDTGHLLKAVGDFPTSHQLVAGVYVLAGPVHVSVDAAFGKHHPWIGPDYGAAFGRGSAEPRFYRWINLNTGFSY